MFCRDQNGGPGEQEQRVGIGEEDYNGCEVKLGIPSLSFASYILSLNLSFPHLQIGEHNTVSYSC